MKQAKQQKENQPHEQVQATKAKKKKDSNEMKKDSNDNLSVPSPVGRKPDPIHMRTCPDCTKVFPTKQAMTKHCEGSRKCT
jgi:hypothetical protein